MTDLAPPDDPAYDPMYKPIGGRVPDAVKRWGKASQLRWWRRFRQELWEQAAALLLSGRPKLPTHDDVDYWCESPHHKGFCCCKDERSRR